MRLVEKGSYRKREGVGVKMTKFIIQMYETISTNVRAVEMARWIIDLN